MDHDPFDMHFHELVRDRKFDEARANLETRKARGEAGDVTAAKQTAYILRAEGKVDQAIATVTAVIQSGGDEKRLCQFYRAGLYLDQGKMQRAEHDYEAVLSENNFITQRFHSFAAFRVAWIKALAGDPSYRTYLDRYPDEAEGFISDRIIARPDIDAVYARRRQGRAKVR